MICTELLETGSKLFFQEEIDPVTSCVQFRRSEQVPNTDWLWLKLLHYLGID